MQLLFPPKNFLRNKHCITGWTVYAEEGLIGLVTFNWATTSDWVAHVWSTLKKHCTIRKKDIWLWLLIIIDKLQLTIIFWPQTQTNQLKISYSSTRGLIISRLLKRSIKACSTSEQRDFHRPATPLLLGYFQAHIFLQLSKYSVRGGKLAKIVKLPASFHGRSVSYKDSKMVLLKEKRAQIYAYLFFCSAVDWWKRLRQGHIYRGHEMRPNPNSSLPNSKLLIGKTQFFEGDGTPHRSS